MKQEFKQYGGSNAMHNGGSLKYVRIEYAGKTSVGFQKFKGLTLAGVGNQTKIDFVQVTSCLGNSFQVYGGGLTMNNLFSYKCKNNDFDITLGAQMNINNSIAIRNINLSNNNESHAVGLKVSSFLRLEMADFSKKMTNVTANNLTIVNEVETPDGSEATLVKEGVKVMPNCNLTLKNTMVSGFTPGILFDGAIPFKDIKLFNIEKVFFNLCGGKYILSETGGAINEDIDALYANKSNVYENLPYVDLFIEPKNEKTPDYRIQLSRIK